MIWFYQLSGRQAVPGRHSHRGKWVHVIGHVHTNGPQLGTINLPNNQAVRNEEGSAAGSRH